MGRLGATTEEKSYSFGQSSTLDSIISGFKLPAIVLHHEFKGENILFKHMDAFLQAVVLRRLHLPGDS